MLNSASEMVAPRRDAMSIRLLVLLVLLCFAAGTHGAKAQEDGYPVSRICLLIEREASVNGLPPDFLARLIWKESRFDIHAVSPAGAEGIAQFMPETARLRGLDDSFDPAKAIPASAAYLSVLRLRYGNLGLAAAAYNTGEGRLSAWLSGNGFLPVETENYVLDITGDPAETFADRRTEVASRPLEDGKPFREACEALPSTKGGLVAMAQVLRKPWAIQVAGNFSRSAAMKSWERVRNRHAAILADLPMAVSAMRTPQGRKPVHAVRVGADSRAEANAICGRIRAGGGSCIVMRN